MLEPEARVDALKSDWAKNLPPDTRARLMRESEAAALDDKAQRVVNSWRGLTATERMEAMQKYSGDADLFDEIKRRSDIKMNQERDAKGEEQKEFLDQYSEMIREGDITVDELKRNYGGEWRAMDSSTKEALRKIEEEPTRTRSDLDTYLTLSALALENTTESRRQLREYFNKNYHMLSHEDQRKFGVIGVDKPTPDEYKSGFTNTQLIAARVGAIPNIESKQATALKSQVTSAFMDWQQTYYTDNGKYPTEKEVTDFIDGQLMVGSEGGWFGGDTRFVEMSDEDWKDTLKTMASSNRTAYESAERYLTNNNITNPTRAQVRELYDYYVSNPEPEIKRTELQPIIRD